MTNLRLEVSREPRFARATGWAYGRLRRPGRAQLDTVKEIDGWRPLPP